MDLQEIKSLAKRLYQIEGDWQILAGYEDSNFQVKTNDTKYVVKLSKDSSQENFLRAQSELLTYLQADDFHISLPEAIPSVNNEFVEKVEYSGTTRSLRLLNWLDGSLLKDVEQNESLFFDIGQHLGRLDSQLAKFNSDEISARESDWDLSNALNSLDKTSFILDPSRKRIADYFFLQNEELVQPKLRHLRKGIIHSDANDFNILVDKESGKFSGLLDFGDCVYSHTINELAIALAYLLMDKPKTDILQLASATIRGYHSQYSLKSEELDILYYLVASRLIVSVSISAENLSLNPENQYLQVTDAQAWNLLFIWIEINPIAFTSMCYQTCGLEQTESLANDTMADRRKHVNPSLSISYNDPLSMEKAVFQYMYAADGRTYLDCVNNISHVGHCHPRIARAGRKQIATLNTNSRYLYRSLSQYARELAAKFPDPLEVVYLVNSGSEAGDLAQRIARTVTGNKSIAVVDQAYHGNTIAGIEVSPYKYKSRGGQGRANHIFELPSPANYSDSSLQEGANELQSAIDQTGEIAAFICESIVGCAGQVMLPNGFLKAIYKTVREAGGICIADEVQVGFGRVGEKYWGFELQDVVPDIVVIGKPMGNGHPLAGVVTTRKIADEFNNGMEYFSSFGGNPVSCIIGLQVLQIIDEEGLQQNALQVGNYFKQELSKLQSEFSEIHEVRGAGLFLGVEFLQDSEPATVLTRSVVEDMRERGVLLSTDGPFSNVIKIKPPMTFSPKNVDTVVGHLRESLNQLT